MNEIPQKLADTYLDALIEISTALNSYDMQTFTSAHATIKNVNSIIKGKMEIAKKISKSP